jgi:DNA-binding CsgD family transcriptional regulator
MIESSAWAPTSALIGRDAERQRLDAVLDHLRQGSAALIVRGEPGIGKSAFLHHARQRAGDLGARVLATVGSESEAELAFAGLHELLRPISSRMVSLPAPRRRALEAAFGLADDLEPDPFKVALAAYQLVCDAADAAPLIVVVDDTHWLDRSSLAVLTFIARRLESEPVALLAAIRDGYATPLEDARLPVLDLKPLDATDAIELLERRAPDLPLHQRDQVLEEAAGNPLALVELARALPDAERLTPAPATMTARLERAFAARLDDLPMATRLVLLAAALDGRASLKEVLVCATRLHGAAVTASAVDRAVAIGLVDLVDTELHFRHPLIRSAVQQGASPAQVLAMYGALAEVVADPERRLWHRAMAVVGADDAVADALDDHAQTARRRGAVLVAAGALERAAALTSDPSVKSERLVRAAELAYELGLVEIVRRLLRQANPHDVGDLEAARLAWLQEMVAGNLWFEAGATQTFVTIARRMRDGGDPDMALRSLVPIAHRCWWTRARTRTRQYLVDAANSAGVRDDDPRLLVVTALAHPEVTGTSVLRRVSRLRLHEMMDPVSAMYVGIAAEKAGDFATGARFLARAIEGLREQSRLGMLAQALTHYAWAAMYSDDWLAAASAGAEAARLARDTRQPQFGLTAELVAALATASRTSEADIDSMLARPEQKLLAMKGGPLLAPAHLARGAAALGEGRYEDAFRHLWPVFDEAGPAFHRFMRWPALLDLVEAAGRGEHAERVGQVVRELEDVATQSEPPILCAALVCARPLTADDDEAEALFAAALAHDLTAHPFLRSRTLFSFGCWLRRRRRNVDARERLHGAIDLFDALGATPWAERARQELRAAGERIGPRTPAARDELTAQELQIARLAADGLSNREIGERLFLSHRTIGSHLYRIFPKLGITSRAQLGGALANAPRSEQAVS